MIVAGVVVVVVVLVLVEVVFLVELMGWRDIRKIQNLLKFT